MFSSVEGIHNTHSTYPRHINEGFDDTHTEPESLAQNKYRPNFSNIETTWEKQKDWENLDEDKQAAANQVYGFKIDDMFNTHSSYPRKVNGGFDNDETAPTESIAQLHAVYGDDFEPDLHFLQIGSQEKMEQMIGFINSPKALAKTEKQLYNHKAGQILAQSSSKAEVQVQGPKEEAKKDAKKPESKIYDADGDGIEDIAFKTFEELDMHYLPAVFGPVEDLYNTLNGEMPGHVHKAFDITQVEPQDTYNLVKLHSI